MKTDARNTRKVENVTSVEIEFIADPKAHRWIKYKKRHGFIGNIDTQTIKGTETSLYKKINVRKLCRAYNRLFQFLSNAIKSTTDTNTNGDVAKFILRNRGIILGHRRIDTEHT